MTTGSDEALDVALGLLRAPALRSTLRDRPLPAGMGELLAVASGSHGRVRDAAARTGLGQGELLEAARFFVQQVLLAEGADAYRVLGVERHALHADIRDHHRHLLRWLHPDRSEGAQWESAFATRVNQAWNHVRTQTARTGYDASLSIQAEVREPVTATAPSVPAGPGTTAVPSPRQPAAAPVAVALIGLLCVVLAWFAIHREDHVEDPGSSAATVATRPAADSRPDVAPRPEASLVDTRQDATGNAASHAFSRPPTSDIVVAQDVPDDAYASALIDLAVDAAQTAPIDAFVEAVAPIPAVAVPAVAPPAIVPVIAQPAAPRDALSDIAEKAAVAVAPARTPSVDPLRLFSEAEAAVHGVASYLAADGGTEPAWLDMPTGLEAAGIRAQLRSRHQDGPRRRMQVETPGWTLDGRAATMLGAYRLAERRDTVETGVLRVELARLDDTWRVSALHLEPAQ